MKIIHNNSWLIGKDLDAEESWKQKEKRVTEDEMIVWHHQFSRHELGQTLWDGKGQGSQHDAVLGIAKSWTWLSKWTELKLHLKALFLENQPEMTAHHKGAQEHTSMYVAVVAVYLAQSRLTLRDYGLEPPRPHCLWNFPSKNTGVGCHWYTTQKTGQNKFIS